MITLLAAVDALSHIGGFDNLTKQVVSEIVLKKHIWHFWALIFETLSVFCSLYLLFSLEKLGDSLVAEDFLLSLISNLMLLEASTSQW